MGSALSADTAAPCTLRPLYQTGPSIQPQDQRELGPPVVRGVRVVGVGMPWRMRFRRLARHVAGTSAPVQGDKTRVVDRQDCCAPARWTRTRALSAIR